MTAGSLDAVVANRSGGAVSAPAGTLRLVMAVGRAEAGRLCRNPLVLAGLVLSAGSIWWTNRSQVPVWWQADVGIGAALLVTAACVLLVAHVAVTRASRDGMSALYESYASSPAVRTGGLLAGLAGPVLLAAVVVGLAVAWLDSQGAAGAPRPAVLAGAVLLVGLGGALGAAIGSWLRHPLASLLVVLVLGFIEVGLVRNWSFLFTGPAGWLFPWRFDNYLLSSMPGLLVPDPPALHTVELGGLIVVLLAAALLPVARRRAALALLATAGLVITGWTGWVQSRPVPMQQVAKIVYQDTHPALAEQCVSSVRVRYCYYPAFKSWVDRWSPVVTGVLALVPGGPSRALVVRQVVDQDAILPPLVPDTNVGLYLRLYNYERDELAAPALIPGSASPPVYTDLSWGQGAAAASYEVNLAMQVAWWVTRLPTTERAVNYSIAPASTAQAFVGCVPVGQAREAIAIWLAASATPATRAASLAGLQGLGTLGGSPVEVGRSWVATLIGTLAPNYGGYQPRVQVTVQAAALARSMLGLPAGTVEAVLARGWRHWLSAAATDAQLAAALHLGLPPAARVTSADLAAAGGYLVHAPADPVCR